MEASELTAMVSKRCPCLRNLFLFLYLVDVSDVVWNGNAYDPRHHTFDNVSPHLRPLEVAQNSAAASFMQQFDKVDDT
nr:unnamed protein product [Digitaria exilis]